MGIIKKINDFIIELGLPRIIKTRLEVGNDSVLNPDTVIRIHSNIYPLSRVRGVVPTHSIFKDVDNIVKKK